MTPCDAIGSYVMLVNCYRTTWRHAPEDSAPHKNNVFGSTKGGKFFGTADGRFNL